ncbi:low molecular weight protein arginine phosphatase [Ectobacillus panaciterrae]|uniref:low molecular weight protein arginine phosphatase n=1 Tax=Ectobacillus panaciterrae TaxID=363872 RepID=UPI00041849B0|nr:low molecular weight protein arginine phosphatase [Ectobacillus panaciterrae]
MKRILFVCTGNTCRSPMAEAVLRHYGDGAFEVKSAGVFAAAGSDASAHAKSALEEKGIQINHTAAQLHEEQLEWADAVLTMTGSHKQLILQYFPNMQEKVFTLYEATDDRSRDISDPFGGSLEVYKATLNEMEQLIQRFIKKHKNK